MARSVCEEEGDRVSASGAVSSVSEVGLLHDTNLNFPEPETVPVTSAHLRSGLEALFYRHQEEVIAYLGAAFGPHAAPWEKLASSPSCDTDALKPGLGLDTSRFAGDACVPAAAAHFAGAADGGTREQRADGINSRPTLQLPPRGEDLMSGVDVGTRVGQVETRKPSLTLKLPPRGQDFPVSEHPRCSLTSGHTSNGSPNHSITSRPSHSSPIRAAMELKGDVSPVRSMPVSHRSLKTLTAQHSRLKRLCSSREFELSITGVIILNALFIGLQVQDRANRQGDAPPADVRSTYAAMEMLFLVIFTTELLMRLKVEGREFFKSREWPWNAFDSVVVFLMLTELALSLGKVSTQTPLKSASVLRMLRIARVFRALRVIRVLRVFRELRMMFASILGSFKPMCWVVLCLALMLYIFGVTLTSGTLDYLAQTRSWTSIETDMLRHRFGTIDAAVMSLFEAMSGGISWGELFDAIKPLSRMYSVVFILFISFAVFGVVNIVTGIFVETAIGASKGDQESVIEEELYEKKELLHHLKALFTEFDADQSGEVSLDEFRMVSSDERMQAYLHKLGLCLDDANCLFALLDRDQSGSVGIEEFLRGCLRLQGQASSLEMAKLELETKWIVHNIVRITEALDSLRESSHFAVSKTDALEEHARHSFLAEESYAV